MIRPVEIWKFVSTQDPDSLPAQSIVTKGLSFFGENISPPRYRPVLFKICLTCWLPNPSRHLESTPACPEKRNMLVRPNWAKCRHVAPANKGHSLSEHARPLRSIHANRVSGATS